MRTGRSCGPPRRRRRRWRARTPPGRNSRGPARERARRPAPRFRRRTALRDRRRPRRPHRPAPRPATAARAASPRGTAARRRRSHRRRHRSAGGSHRSRRRRSARPPPDASRRRAAARAFAIGLAGHLRSPGAASRRLTDPPIVSVWHRPVNPAGGGRGHPRGGGRRTRCAASHQQRDRRTGAVAAVRRIAGGPQHRAARAVGCPVDHEPDRAVSLKQRLRLGQRQADHEREVVGGAAGGVRARPQRKTGCSDRGCDRQHSRQHGQGEAARYGSRRLQGPARPAGRARQAPSRAAPAARRPPAPPRSRPPRS